MHYLYIVRPGDDNEPLRYSLRSLEKAPDVEDVWIVGHKPSWVTGVHHIPGNPTRRKQVNVYGNILTACTNTATPDRFVVMNDDFFFTRKVRAIPNWHRGPLDEHIGILKSNGWWKQSLMTTLRYLRGRGITRPLSYELHKPIEIDKHLMAQTLAEALYIDPRNPPQWRTLYGNLHRIGGVRHDDFKVYRDEPLQTPFHSTNDVSFPRWEPALHAAYPRPCAYEDPNPVSTPATREFTRPAAFTGTAGYRDLVAAR